ncbi:cytochrome P450 2B19 isoform X1 [Patella vulgata]|uniref:cytochrome P450 2B19 isoform X1 n=1 Tax=Patella vulgata TaxID=6465 RepID=UPI0024A936E2|nr:cytochrome P450 2B19 isoform X1 [Patella vulgata]
MAGFLKPFQDTLQGINMNLGTVLLVGVCIGIWLLSRKPRGIPPGPRFTLPFVGDLLFLEGGGDVRVATRQLRKKYGDIFSVYFGPKLFIFINGYDLIKEALVKRADEFTNRPPMFINDLLSKRKGIVFSSGQLWKEQRKFALETLREFGFGRTVLEDKILEEIGYYVEVIGKHNGKAFNIQRLTQTSVSNVISSIVYGQRFDYGDPVFIDFVERVDENFAVAGSSSLLNFLPVLRFLPGDFFKFKRTIRNNQTQEMNLIEPSVNDHLKNYDENNTNDFISSYIKEMKRVEKSGEESTIDKDNLIKSIGDLFVAGTETTSTTILWTILYLLHNPSVQAKCYKEIQDVVGSGRLPSMKDRSSMPYTQAVLLEVLRIANIAIVGLPHTVGKDVIFHGYVIPKHTVVFGNIDSVLADDGVWGDAGVFRPERFLDENGQLVKREEFIPFSLGRRICLGESLAKMELFLFMTTLIQRFEFKPVDPNNLPTLKGILGLAHSPTQYEVRALPR